MLVELECVIIGQGRDVSIFCEFFRARRKRKDALFFYVFRFSFFVSVFSFLVSSLLFLVPRFSLSCFSADLRVFGKHFFQLITCFSKGVRRGRIFYYVEDFSATTVFCTVVFVSVSVLHLISFSDNGLSRGRKTFV